MLHVLAVLPAAVLLIWIGHKDKIEKEPFGLLVKLFLLGALTTVSAVILGTILENIFGIFLDPESLPGILADNFLSVALIEEGGKYFVLKKKTWNHPAFNYTFDAVVYAVTVSLGFATLENILYLSGGTLNLAIMRGILAVPGHAIDAVFMGYYYGLAKHCDAVGDKAGCRSNLHRALLVPMLLHGFYDFTLSMESDLYIGIFFVFEVIITITAFKKVNRLSREDAPIAPVPDLTVQNFNLPPYNPTNSFDPNDPNNPNRWGQ